MRRVALLLILLSLFDWVGGTMQEMELANENRNQLDFDGVSLTCISMALVSREEIWIL